MKLYKYLFEFSGEKNFSLGLINERKVDETRVLDLYFLLHSTALKFARENLLNFIQTPATSKEALEVKDISEYIYLEGSFNEKRFRRHLTWLFTKGKIPRFPVRIRTLPPFDELVGREGLLQKIENLIKEKNVSLRAPRCYGKTSILNAIFERPPQGWQPLFIQARNLQNPAAFVGAIAYELTSDSAIERQVKRELIEKQAERALTDTLTSLLPEDKHHLLLVDEFAEFLRNLKENKALKDFDNGFCNFFNLPKIRFIIASSEAEDRISGNKGLKILSNFEKVNVPLLKDDEAGLLLEELAYNSGIIPKKGEIERIKNLLKTFIPYFIHIFVSVWNEGNKEISPEEVYERLLGKEGWNLLRDFQELPKRYPPKLISSSYSLLSEMAIREQGIEKGEAKAIFKEKAGADISDFEEMIQRLIDDLLIEEQKERYYFKASLLKEFWRRFPT